MIASGWRRLGISPTALVVLSMAGLALMLSRGAGAGWLVVIASVFIGVVAVAAVAAIFGVLRVRVALEVPTDAVAGELLTMFVSVSSLVPQLRTLTLHNLDGSTHALERNGTHRIGVRAERRSLIEVIEVEVRGGLPLGIIRPARRFTVALPVPLAVAPIPAVVSLLEALGEDDTADVRAVRSYVAGDAARLVHWRSTARRGELMVREFESIDLLRGARLELRLSLAGDHESVEAAASEAAGVAIAAINAGLRVELLTREAAGARSGAVATRREVGRRLAAAITGEPPLPHATAYVVEVPRR